MARTHTAVLGYIVAGCALVTTVLGFTGTVPAALGVVLLLVSTNLFSLHLAYRKVETLQKALEVKEIMQGITAADPAKVVRMHAGDTLRLNIPAGQPGIVEYKAHNACILERIT